MFKSEQFESAFNSMLNSLNVLGSSAQRERQVREAFSRTHRTLQQQFVRVIILPVLMQLSEQHVLGEVDARNAASAALANKMLNAVVDDDLYLPFV